MSLFDAYVWIQANWKSLGWPVAVLFAFLWWNKGCPKVDNQPQTVVNQAQASTQKTEFHVRPSQKPVVVGQPLPCPEIDFSTTEAHWQTQAVTVTPAINPTRHELGVFIGGGYLSTPVATLGGFYGPWRVGALASTTAIGGLASYDIRF